MKKKISILTLLALFLIYLPGCSGEPLPPRGTSPANPNYIEPQTYNFKNQPDGFNGLKWGISLEEAERIKNTKFHLHFDDPEYNKKFFVIPNQDNIIFGVHFPEIFYVFRNNNFTSVNITHIADPKQVHFDKLFKAMRDTYGMPTRTIDGPSSDIYQWRGTKTYMSLSYNNRIKSTFIDFKSPSIAYFSVYHAERQAEREQARKEKEKQN